MEIKDLKHAIDAYSDAAETGLSALENRIDDVETRLLRPNMGGEVKASGLDLEHKEAFIRDFMVRGDDEALKALEAKALSTTRDGTAGFAVPEMIDSEIEKQVRRHSPMRSICKVKTIETSEYTRLVNTADTQTNWVGEEDARATTSGPNLEEIKITPGEIYANAAVTQRALDDMQFDVEAWLTEDVADEFARMEGQAIVGGNGVNKPKGILTYPTNADEDNARTFGTIQHLVSGAASGLPSNDPDAAELLVDLVHLLNSRYRQGAVFLMNSKTLSVVRKLQDSDGNFLFRAGMTPGEKGMLLGYPVVEAEDMDDIAAGNAPIAFGNFERAYTIVERMGTRVLRDPYSQKPNVQFYATKRVGGALVNDAAVKLLKIEA